MQLYSPVTNVPLTSYSLNTAMGLCSVADCARFNINIVPHALIVYSLSNLKKGHFCLGLLPTTLQWSVVNGVLFAHSLQLFLRSQFLFDGMLPSMIRISLDPLVL